MEGKKITAVLAGILAAACLIVTIVLVSVNSKTKYLPVTAVDDLVDVLDAAGIGIDPDIIETKRERGDVFVFDSADYYDTVAGLLCKESVSETFATPDGNLLLFENGAILEFGADFSFRYSKDGKKHSVPDREYMTEATLDPTGEYKDAAEEAVKFLNSGSRSFAQSENISIITNADIVFGDGEKYYVECSRTLDGVAITDNTVVCTYCDGEVIAAEGKWCFFTSGESYSAQLTDHLNILFNARNDIIIPERKKVNITSVEKCYSLYYYGDGEDFCLIPCWQISTDIAGDYIYSALDGTIYTNN